MKLCVYCGSRSGNDARFAQAARALGLAMAQAGHALVYGGGHVGLMGIVADALLEAKGTATGVIPQALMDREVGHSSLTELLVVNTMHERKLVMAERSDAFVALPGGIGTLEELYEVWSWRQLGIHQKPVALLNVAGYYDGLLSFMRSSVTSGFVSAEHHRLLIVESDVTTMMGRLTRAIEGAAPDDTYRLL
jgi:uncharacterized protein (TIGR00730 family)